MSIVQILQLIFLLICLFFPFIINILIIPTLLYRFWEKYSFLKFYFWHYNQTTSYGKKISMLLLSSSFSFLSVPPSSSSLSVPMCSASSVRWVAQNVLTALHLSLTHMQLLVVHIHPPLIHIHLTSALCLTGWRGKGWGGQWLICPIFKLKCQWVSKEHKKFLSISTLRLYSSLHLHISFTNFVNSSRSDMT